jgi:hypothetical protein
MSKLVAAREVGRNTDASLQARGRVKYILHADSHKMRYWVTHPSRPASEQLGEAYKYLFIASDRTDANGLECTVGKSKGGSSGGHTSWYPIRCVNCDPHGITTVFGAGYGKWVKDTYGSDEAV